jgi:hypothetical protein
MSSNDDILISKLIEETCTDGVEKDQPNSFVDLRNYFEKRLNEVDFISIADYLDQHHLDHQELSLQSQSGCYRLVLKQSILDFPSNWSIFSSIKDSDLVFLNQSMDQDYLLDLFAELCGNFQNIALVKENKKVKLVFLPEDSSMDHLKWMRDFFEKKNSDYSEKKAA